MSAALHGPTLMLASFAAAGVIVFVLIAWERDRAERRRRRWDGIEEWKRTQAALPQRQAR